ncbi:MAG: acetylornithine deacetylase [Cyanobacteria bacterium RYN_339]|nr:acetylornithine deacetylase [Cyanobacteria bacterium RYN_339]
MYKQWLKDLIAIPSPSGGEEAVAAYLAAWAKPYEVHQDAGNVMVRLPGKNPRRALILHAHMDVVPPGDPARWTTPPYVADERDGKIFGSGASDDKAGIAVCMAVAAAQTEQPPVDLWLVWVVCEETDASGSIAFAAWFKQHHQDRYDEVGAVIFESTESRWLEYEAKGSLFLKVTTEGGSGHGAMKDKLGTSAITHMAEAVRLVDVLEAGWRDKGLDQPTALVTSVRAGDPAVPNKLEPTCELVVDMRTTSAMHDGAIDELRGTLAGIPHQVDVLSACPPGYTAPDAPFIQAFERVLPGVEKQRSFASNDQFAFTGLGVPAFVFGPGCQHAIHRPNEYVEVASLERSVAIVTQFLQDWGTHG